MENKEGFQKGEIKGFWVALNWSQNSSGARRRTEAHSQLHSSESRKRSEPLSLERKKKERKSLKKSHKGLYKDVETVRFNPNIRVFYRNSNPGSARLTRQPSQPLTC